MSSSRDSSVQEADTLAEAAVTTAIKPSDRQLEAWHERQEALAEWRKKDTPANRERLELARNAMDLLLRDDGMDCE